MQKAALSIKPEDERATGKKIKVYGIEQVFFPLKAMYK